MGKGNRVRTQNADERKMKKEIAAKKAAKEKAFHRLTAVVCIILAVALAFTFLWAAFLKDFVGRKSMQGAVLLKTENFSVNASEFTYLYMSTYLGYQGYAQYLGFSTTTPLKDQLYTNSGIDGYTWHDSFVDMTESQINDMLILCEAAKERGIELDDEDKKNIDAEIEAIKTTADSQNMSVKKFLKTYFGEYVTVDDIRSCMELQMLASKAEEAMLADFEYTDEELEKYCQDNKKSFYFSDYRTIEIKADYVSGAKEEVITAAKAEAKAIAEKILNASKDEATFLKAVEEYYRDVYNVVPDKTEDEKEEDKKEESSDKTEAPTEKPTETTPVEPSEPDIEAPTDEVAEAAEDKKDEDKKEETKKQELTESKLQEKIDATLKKAQAYTLDTDLGKWLYEQSSEEANKGEYVRKAGDAKLIEDKDNGKYTVYVVVNPMYRNDFKVRDVRHILFSTEEGKEGALSDADAKAKAEEILKEWKDGEATEESFGELAKKHSMDTDPSNGGLYEDVVKGKMVAEFENWLFSAKEKGETGIVKTEYGYHVMYYVGEAEDAKWMTDAETSLKNEDYTKAKDAVAEKYPITVGEEKLFKKVKQAGT